MMTKNLKNKVLLSVFAGAMVFSCTDLPEQWYLAVQHRRQK